MVRDGADEDGIMGCEVMADELDGWDGIVVDVVAVDDDGVMIVSGGGGGMPVPSKSLEVSR